MVNITAEGMPRFNEKTGPFSLARQFIEFAWDKTAKNFDNEKLQIILGMAGTAFQTDLIRKSHKEGLLQKTEMTEMAEEISQLSPEQKRSIIRRKTLYSAASQILQIVRFEMGEEKYPLQTLQSIEKGFWSSWNTQKIDNNSFYLRDADNISLSMGHSSRNNHEFITETMKSLANAAGLPKKDRIVSVVQAPGPIPDTLNYLVGVDARLFKRLEKKYNKVLDHPGHETRDL